MTDLSIAQILFENESVRAESANFPDELLEPAGRLCKAFGAPAAHADCPDSCFANPLGKNFVGIVQIVGRPQFVSLRYRILAVGRELYFHLNDPFAIAERFPPEWEARGSLPVLEWPLQPLPNRTVAQLEEILKHGDSPFLLGAAQSLVDGGKIALQRETADRALLQNLWALLPESTRRTLWPATFTFSNILQFDVLIAPSISEGDIPGYLTDEQVRDYPDSHYERGLQVAVESGDQAMLDRLLSRRGSEEIQRLGVSIIFFALGVAVIFKALSILKVI